ncbi:MAG: MucB/RseB N-terminal domain [Abditibacteriota bacterium]|nr:MucB/RseB N-terminal domain [Abditibacteriota bacterium]
MNASVPSRYGLFLVSAIVLALAFGLWNERAHQAQLQATALRERQMATQDRQQTQHAVALLIRAFVADNQLKYSAISQTTATYADQKLQTQAKITRTPESMAIVYLDGDRKGLNSGFNQKWFWRHKPGSPMQAYAAVEQDATEMAAKRFAMLLDNYEVKWLKEDTIAGRAVELVEIHPIKPLDGAKGPGKKLGIDKETGLTVLTTTYNYQWQPVMSSTLREIDFTPTITPDTFASPTQIMDMAKKKPWMAREMGTHRDEVARTTGVVPPQPKELPRGFAFDGVGIHRCETIGQPSYAALTRYTDGLNTLTVFAMKDADVQREKVLHEGSANAKNNATKDATEKDTAASSAQASDQSCDFGPGTLVIRDVPQGRIIAVSDLPAVTLRRVVENTSLQLHGAAGK